MCAAAGKNRGKAIAPYVVLHGEKKGAEPPAPINSSPFNSSQSRSMPLRGTGSCVFPLENGTMGNLAETGLPFAFLLAVAALVVGVCALIDTATRHRRFPNWFMATRAFSAPSTSQANPRWKLCYYRDTPEHKLMDRRIAVATDGLLVRDHSPFVFPRPHTILIPWASLSNPKEVTIPLYYLRLWRRGVQLEVDGTDMTIVVSKEMWPDVERNLLA